MASPTATSPGSDAIADVKRCCAATAPPAPPAPPAPTLRRKQKRSHTAKKANRPPAPPAADPRVQRLNRAVAQLKAEHAAKKVTEDNPRGDSTWNTDMNTHDKKIKDLRAEAHRQHEVLHQSGHGDASKSAGARQLWGFLGKKRVWKGEVIKGGRRMSRRRRRRRRTRRRRKNRRRRRRRQTRRRRKNRRKKRKTRRKTRRRTRRRRRQRRGGKPITGEIADAGDAAWNAPRRAAKGMRNIYRRAQTAYKKRKQKKQEAAVAAAVREERDRRLDAQAAAARAAGHDLHDPRKKSSGVWHTTPH